MEGKSKSEIESAVGQALSEFLKKQMGEKAEAVIAQVMGDTIIVRFKGVMYPAERQMARDEKGVKLIKEVKGKLIERAKPLLGEMVKNLTKAEVIDIHSSFDPATGERIEIFTLSENLDKIVI